MSKEAEKEILGKIFLDLVNDPRFIKLKKEREDRKRYLKKIKDWGKQPLDDIKTTHDDLFMELEKDAREIRKVQNKKNDL